MVRAKQVVPDAAQLANEWAPSIATLGRSVVLAWLDFRNYNWDVFASASKRGGLRYPRRNVRVDDSEEFERINSHPSVAYDPTNARLVLVWSDQRAREVDSNIFSATSSDAGATWSTPVLIDSGDVGLDPDEDVASNQWQPEVAAADGRACVAWQDDRLGNNDIFAALSVDGGATFALEERVDDSSTGPSEQFGPAVALSATRCYVVWSDNRSGDADIRFASKSF